MSRRKLGSRPQHLSVIQGKLGKLGTRLKQTVHYHDPYHTSSRVDTCTMQKPVDYNCKHSVAQLTYYFCNLHQATVRFSTLLSIVKTSHIV